ncbi:MAG: ATP-binding protein [Hyphomonadaceae bacterium]|nr:ATP-binding protein [Hyphomonadaceae bacterium]
MFKVTARTILELGSELISSDIIAFYELIKNGFDAGTKSGVEIRFDIVLRRNAYLTLCNKATTKDADFAAVREAARNALNNDAQDSLVRSAQAQIEKATTLEQLSTALKNIYLSNTIAVSDTGSGMSLSELSETFLVIGTSSRKLEVEKALARGDTKSPFLGEKGIGRLSAMRLGERLRVETARRSDRKLNTLDIDWSAFAKLDLMLDQVDVAPKAGSTKEKSDWCGTRIIISDLAEDWTEQRVREMAEYDFARLTDPFLDQKHRPRIVLFWNGQRLTVPWMNQTLINNAHARISGSYVIDKGVPSLRCRMEAIDLGFEHPREVEQTVVSGDDLQSAVTGTSQEIHDTALVTLGPFSFEAHWYNRRRLGRIDGIGEMRAVRDLQEKWSGILLFRDGFRVFPYGDDEDDWLALDRKALRRSGYTLNKTQFIGRVRISRTANPDLVDQTNREGLRETPEQQVLLGLMQYAIQDMLFPFMRNVERQYKGQKVDLSEAKLEVTRLEDRAKVAIKQLRRVAPVEGKEAVENLEQALFEFSEFAERARARIAEVEQESRQMIEMAGVGLMVEVVAHELARASENALENLEGLRGRAVPDDVRARLESLRAQMKSLSKRVRVLDPLSVSGRQRFEVFSLDDLIRDTLEAHEAQFNRHNIRIKLDLPEKTVRVRAVKGMVVQILENLISNSKYWLEMRKGRDSSFKPTISITLEARPPTVIFEDNGPGIAPENREKIFRPFFSLKEKSKRRGLGLFIARECAEYTGGSLVLDEHVDRATSRLHRFIFELPETTTN